MGKKYDMTKYEKDKDVKKKDDKKDNKKDEKKDEKQENKELAELRKKLEASEASLKKAKADNEKKVSELQKEIKEKEEALKAAKVASSVNPMARLIDELRKNISFFDSSDQTKIRKAINDNKDSYKILKEYHEILNDDADLYGSPL